MNVKGWGTHCSSYNNGVGSYLTMAAGIGIEHTDVDAAMEKLTAVLEKIKSKSNSEIKSKSYSEIKLL